MRLCLYAVVALLVLTLAAPFTWGGSISSLQAEMSKLFEQVKPSVPTVVYTIGDKELVSTGIVMNRGGYILTTKDFSGKPGSIEVQFPNNKRSAKLIGYDRESKLAVLQVKGTGLVPAKIGNSDKVKPATWVMIVGNSLGISPSVSIGLVSGKRAKDGMFQISASISPGNSGAGVFNSDGELIGIVLAALTRPLNISLGEGKIKTEINLLSRGELPVGGSGLMIPINRARKSMQDVIEHGTTVYGWLGVMLRALNDKLKSTLGVDRGALVADVVEDSPAEKAGFKEDDVIITYGRKAIEDVPHLVKIVKATKPGTTVKIVVSRKGKKRTLKVKLGERPEEDVLLNPWQISVPQFLKEYEKKTMDNQVEKLKKEIEELKKEVKKLKKGGGL